MNQPNQLKAQFIRFDRGISQYNHDYYAALGLPIISNPNYIRNVYLRIARILHPDVYGFSADEKIIATQYLAKLVNPAYNALMKEQDRNAYQEIFKLLAKRLMLRSRNITIHSECACELIMTPSDDVYERLVTEIAKVQYQDLHQILNYTAQISELNLVYILHKEGYRHGASNMPPVLAPKMIPTGTKVNTQNLLPPPSKPSYGYNLQYTFEKEEINQYLKSDATVIQAKEDTLIQDYDQPDQKVINNRIKVCEIYILQSNWKAALQDLREILRMDANNSKCLALLGVVYMNINQIQMAKASFKRSLYINPQEPLALKHLAEIEQLENSQVSQNNKGSKERTVSKVKPPTLRQSTPSPKGSWLSHLLKWFS